MAIDIKVSDGIDSSIASKLLSIANGADSAQKNVDALVKRMNMLDASKLKAVNKAAVDASKVSLNTQREAYYAAREKVELAKLKTEQARTAKADADRYSQFSKNAQALATTKSLDAEKIAQARLATAEKSAKAAVTNAEAMTKQAAANVKTQYQNQLLQYTGNWAKQDNDHRNVRTQTAQAQLGVVQARQDEIIAKTLLTQQKYNTELNRGAKEAANTAVAQQRLATETQRTSTATINAATAQQRLTSASANAQAAISRSNTAMATHNARLSNLRNSGRAGAGGIRELSSAMSQLDTSASFLRSDGLRWAKVLWALSGATLTAHAVVGAADAYTLLQNRLSVVAEKQEDVNVLTEEMFALASRTRQPVADVTKSFARFDMAMKEMGRTQKDTLVLTETVGKALQMSGATAGESASAMLQLSQAFNKGKLDGDEFRSMMENAPLIANALSKELGVTRGELLKLAPAGKLTVEQLTKAITNAAPQINELFQNFKWTIAQSFTYLRNEVTKFFGELDAATGFTQAISAAIRTLADNMDTLLFVILAATPALALFVGAKMLSGFGTLIGFLSSTAIAIGAIRSPLTVAAVSMANLARQGVATGISLTTMFTSSTTRSIAFRMSVVGAVGAVLALGNAAARAGTMMMAAFSFGNVVLLLGTLVAAAIAFGDKIEMAGEKSFTMRDYVIAAFSEIWGFTKYIFESVYDFIADMFGASGAESMTFGEKVLSTFENIVMFGAAMVDSLQQVFSVMWKVFRVGVAAVADGIRGIIYLVSESIVSLVNGAIDQINTLTSGANAILDWTGASSIFGNFGAIGKVKGMEFKSALVAELNSDWSMKTDVMDGAAAFLGRIKDGAAERSKKRNAEGGLRGYDATQAAKFAAANKDKEKEKKAKDKKPKKSAEERRAEIIEKAMNAELKAIAVAKTYGDERERVNAVEAVNNKLKEKNYALLTAGEEKALRSLVDQRLAAERVGTALQSLYEEAVNPQRNFVAGQEAVNILLNDGVITSAKAANMNKRLAESYAEATDKLYALKKAVIEQDVGYGKFGVDADIAKNIYDAQENAKSKGIADLNAEEKAAIDAVTRSIYDRNKAQEAAQAVWEATSGEQESLAYQVRALDNAYKQGSVSVGEFTRQMAGLQAQQGALVEHMYGLQDPTEPFRRGLYQLAADMPSLGQGMADAMQSTLGNAIDNIAGTMTEMIMNFDAYAESVSEALGRPVSTLDVLRYALSDIVKQIGTELIGAVIKLGVQWAIQAAMGTALQESMAATAIATQTATAAAINTAWTPAAISASIATMGSAATAGVTGYAAAQATGRGMSILGAFADGGEVRGAGTGRSDSVLARLSDGEHVIKADVAKKNRPLLNAMNSGHEIGAGNVDNSVHIYVTVNGDGSSSVDSEQANQFAKNLTGMVKNEVMKQFANQSRQGHSFYGKGR